MKGRWMTLMKQNQEPVVRTRWKERLGVASSSRAQRFAMKRERCPLISLAALIFAVAVSGCNTVSTSSHQYLGGPTYPPTDPAQVQVLRTEPTRPHVQLGQVQAEPSSSSVGNPQIEQALQKAAAKMGANAVVIVQDTTRVTGAVVSGPLWARSVNRITGRVIVGVAIRYLASN